MDYIRHVVVACERITGPLHGTPLISSSLEVLTLVNHMT